MYCLDIEDMTNMYQIINEIIVMHQWEEGRHYLWLSH